MGKANKVVLAYSGGLDTSVIIPWLKENYGAEVIAVCVDLGQPEDYDAVEKKAIKSGASKAYIVDAKEDFVKDYVWPTVKAGAVYEGKYLLGTSFARPLIGKILVDIAKKEGADAIAHGATGKGNDQVRFELAIKALAPNMKIIAPWREWDLKSRTDCMEYAAKHDIPVVATKSHPYSMDQNVWHLSHEGGDLENPANAPKDDVYLVTHTPEQAPDEAGYVTVSFKDGVPVAVDGQEGTPLQLLEKLNEIGAHYGVGVVDIVENRLVGIVTVDDAINVLQDEAEEDFEKMAAMSPTEESYFETSVFKHAKNRIVWLLILMLSSAITGTIITNYENAFAAVPLLVAFIPMLMDTGGNCGSQSSTLIIRGLATDELEVKDVFKILWKEVRIAIIVGATLSVINGLRIFAQYKNLQLACTVGLSITVTVILSKSIGCLLPLLAKKLKLDPAIMAAPLITTIVDILSVLVYFNIATVIMGI
mgnify:CR=1 FL=1